MNLGLSVVTPCLNEARKAGGCAEVALGCRAPSGAAGGVLVAADDSTGGRPAAAASSISGVSGLGDLFLSPAERQVRSRSSVERG